MSSRISEKSAARLYVAAIAALFPLALLLALFLRFRVKPRTVVHIGELRHLQYQFVAELRRAGIDVIYVGIGNNRFWTDADVIMRSIPNPFVAALRDLWVLFSVVAEREVVHCHCLMGISHYQWDIFLLRLMGRRIVGHIRGCEGRTPMVKQNPNENICADCDYLPEPLCLYRENRRRRAITARLAHELLVTTPDLLDFWPKARHVRFFLPAADEGTERPPLWTPASGRPLEIVHVTNQPGIEGTEAIRAAIDRLKAKGRLISFRHLTGIPHRDVMAAYANADLAIGKLKMGYYANAQVESMVLGVPTLTWVRPDLMTQDVREAGFIFSSLDELEETLESIYATPEILHDAATRAHDDICALHDPVPIIKCLEEAYGWC